MCIIITDCFEVPQANTTNMTGVNRTEMFYDCRLNYSPLSVYGNFTSTSLVASIVSIILLFITVAYMWSVGRYHIMKSLIQLQFFLSFRLSGTRQLQKLRGGKKEENEV